MTREETVKALGKGLGYYTQSLIGKAYDCGSKESYRQGFSDANSYASKVMIACACLALNETYGFGYDRMQRFANAFRAKLLDVLDGSDALEEVEKRFGISLKDEFFEED